VKCEMIVRVEQPDEKRVDELGVRNWPTLEKEVCRIDWFFDSTEESYFLAGRVIVETEDGQRVEVKKGDLAVFPKGLKCTWFIEEPMQKHFNILDD